MILRGKVEEQTGLDKLMEIIISSIFVTAVTFPKLSTLRIPRKASVDLPYFNNITGLHFIISKFRTEVENLRPDEVLKYTSTLI